MFIPMQIYLHLNITDQTQDLHAPTRWWMSPLLMLSSCSCVWADWAHGYHQPSSISKKATAQKTNVIFSRVYTERRCTDESLQSMLCADAHVSGQIDRKAIISQKWPPLIKPTSTFRNRRWVQQSWPTWELTSACTWTRIVGSCTHTHHHAACPCKFLFSVKGDQCLLC